MAASKKFLELLDEMRETHLKKSAGYAGMDNPDTFANFRLSENLGVSAFLGCMIRLSDKYTRACNLIKNPKNEQLGEKLKDTLIDLASYALIAICLLEENKDS